MSKRIASTAFLLICLSLSVSAQTATYSQRFGTASEGGGFYRITDLKTGSIIFEIDFSAAWERQRALSFRNALLIDLWLPYFTNLVEKRGDGPEPSLLDLLLSGSRVAERYFRSTTRSLRPVLRRTVKFEALVQQDTSFTDS